MIRVTSTGNHRLKYEIIVADMPNTVTILSKKPASIDGSDPWVGHMVALAKRSFEGVGKVIIVNHASSIKADEATFCSNGSYVRNAIDECDFLILADGKAPRHSDEIMKKAYAVGRNANGSCSVPSRFPSSVKNTGYPFNMSVKKV